jgi:hypothetical protein
MKNKLVFNNNTPHLGGNLENGDPETFSPNVWNFLLSKCSPKKILDLGCGRGHTSKWFIDNNIEVISVDGLEENVTNSIVPAVMHDLTVSPFKCNVDLVICIEVVEHIEGQYIENLLDSLCNGSFIYMTHAVPGQTGYHHVNCQDSEYWINHLEKRNYRLLADDSEESRRLATLDKAKWIAQNGMLFKNEN